MRLLVEKIIVLSGPIASGKSTLGRLLVERHNATLIKTHELIRTQKPNVGSAREEMQAAGEALDRGDKGLWVRDALVRRLSEMDADPDLIVIDAVRIPGQIEGLRQAYSRNVVHVHLTANTKELSRRYSSRDGQFEELPDYEDVKKSETEANIEQLAELSDVRILTDRSTPEEIYVRVAVNTSLLKTRFEPLVDVAIGGQYGSEGKGNIVSYIAKEYDYLIRVGGPNAGHKVYEEPEPYTHHQLPSGTRTSDAKLIIGPGAVLNVEELLSEINECRVDHRRLFIDPQAMTIEKSDIAYERKELEARIGSTARGVGAAQTRRINERYLIDNGSTVRLARDRERLKPYVRPTIDVLEEAYGRGQRLLLEGTQGTALSIYHGYYPHVTSRDTTVSGCLAEVGIPPSLVRRVMMVCRTYPIRVGNPTDGTSGPMSGEISKAEISRRSGISVSQLNKIEVTSTTNRPRRHGEFDWHQLRQASLLNHPTDIALTFVDYLDSKNVNARRYEQLADETIKFVEEVERVSGAPVSLISTRFHFRNIIDRRAWN